MPSSADAIELLTNYPKTGIGDFGLALRGHLDQQGCRVEVLETDPNGEGTSGQLRHLAAGHGPLLVNVGLTAWGRSAMRNLSGFRAVGRRVRQGDAVVAIIHHTIEQFGAGDSGYPIHRWTRQGAHYALSRLSGCRAVVFSPRIRQTLVDSYGWPDPWLTALPCEEGTTPAPGPVGSGLVVTAGYLAPYKGLDLFLDAASIRKRPARWSIVGLPHRVLSSDPVFETSLARWRVKAEAAHVSMPGYVAPEELQRQWTAGTVGVLCYTSVSGASASFSMFAERGIPVVATNLPEFRFLRDQGAGVVLVEARPDDVARTVESVASDPVQWESLSRAQLEFARRFSWRSFAKSLIELLLHRSEGGPAGIRST